jgi:hypothetical protein
MAEEERVALHQLASRRGESLSSLLREMCHIVLDADRRERRRRDENPFVRLAAERARHPS